MGLTDFLWWNKLERCRKCLPLSLLLLSQCEVGFD